MRRLSLAWVALVLVSFGVTSACDSEDTAPPVADGGAPGAGEGGQVGTPPTSGGGDAGSHDGTSEGGHGEGGSGASGGQSAGGVPSGGGAGASADAGGPALAAAGAAGADGGGPPDLIESSGGPWPDSFTAYCAATTSLIPCPQAGEPFFGQDGTYRINVPSYTTTATTMTDSVTGLTWELNPTGADKTHAEALAHCEALDLAGHTDWRLPSRLEYVSVLDLGLPKGFAMPPPVGAGTTGAHWTSSVSGASEDAVFTVNDTYGLWTLAVDTTPLTARCVRGPVRAGSVQVGTETAIDSLTNLEWQRTNLDDSPRSWEAALDHCESLEHAGKTDWRLPNIKELATLVDESAAEALIIDAALFGDSQAASYWSSTPAVSFSAERFAITLETTLGTSPSIKMTETASARCVRTAD